MRRGAHGVAAGLFVLVWLSSVWFGSWVLNPNNATRLFGAIALVEQGNARIDRFESVTIDKAEFDGRYYMDKAPGVTLMAVPAVWAVDRLTGITAQGQVVDAFDPHFQHFLKRRMTLAVAIGAAPLTALAAVLLFDLGTGITGSVVAGLVAALGYACGTTIWGWSTTLFGHAPAAALLTIAAWSVWRGTSDAHALARWRYPLLAGAALGWAVVIEFPTAIPACLIGLWALCRTRRLAWSVRLRLYLPTLAVALAMLVPLIVYNEIAFGTAFRLGYEGVVGFHGMDRGLFGLTYPKPLVLLKLVVGSERGMLWVAPVLAAGAGGLGLMIADRRTRDLGVLAAGCVIAVLLLNASYVYWDGGASTGPRHSVTAMPFLALGLAPLWAWLKRGVARIGLALLLGISMLLNLLIAATNITGPEKVAWPLWKANVLPAIGRQFDTLPSDWWGWQPWRGMALYLIVALPLLWLIVRAAVRDDRRLSGA